VTPAKAKCASPFCARDGVKGWRGTHRPGRPPIGSAVSVKYCSACYERLRRGISLSPRRTDSYDCGVLDAARIAEHHGAPEVAAILRFLATRSTRVATRRSRAPEANVGDSGAIGDSGADESHINGAGET
jgi:hypothetical protein